MEFKLKIRHVLHQVRPRVQQGTLQYTWTTLRSWESRATDATKPLLVNPTWQVPPFKHGLLLQGFC